MPNNNWPRQETVDFNFCKCKGYGAGQGRVHRRWTSTLETEQMQMPQDNWVSSQGRRADDGAKTGLSATLGFFHSALEYIWSVLAYAQSFTNRSMYMCNCLHIIRHQRKTIPVKTFLSLWSNNVFDRQNVICGVLKQFDMPKDRLLPFEKADCLIWNTMQNTMQLAKSFVL